MLIFLIIAYFPTISTVFIKILFQVNATGNRNRCHVSVFTIVQLYLKIEQNTDNPG